MLTDGRTDVLTDGQMDDGQEVITIAHAEQSSGELKITSNCHVLNFFLSTLSVNICTGLCLITTCFNKIHNSKESNQT